MESQFFQRDNLPNASVGQDKAEKEDNASEEEEEMVEWKGLNFPWFFKPERQHFNILSNVYE